MKIAAAKEVKTHEYGVGMTPSGVEAFVARGRAVSVVRGAGEGAGFTEAGDAKAGARVEADKRRLFAAAALIAKARELT